MRTFFKRQTLEIDANNAYKEVNILSLSVDITFKQMRKV
jgi:hypothetical protein